MQTKVLACSIALLLCVSGCARGPVGVSTRQAIFAPPPPPPMGPGAQAGAGAGQRAPGTTRLQHAPALLTPASQLSVGNAATYIPGDTYTRLKINSKNASNDVALGANPEVYPYKTRSPIERFFVGTRHSATLTVKVDSGPFVAVVPLLTVSHDSTSKGGEVFDRAIRHEANAFPIFLVGHNAGSDTASLMVELTGNDKVESSAAANALSAVLAVAGAAGAPAPLVTSLSKDSSKAVAGSIDSAINALFAMKLSERQVVEHAVRAWRPVTIELRLPRHQGGWQKRTAEAQQRGGDTYFDDLDYMTIGTWTVSFEDPRISAFSAATLTCTTSGACTLPPLCTTACDLSKAQAVVRAEIETHLGDVLTFPLIRDAAKIGTLGSYLRQLDWWATDLKALDAAKAPADGFCRKIRDAVIDLGFSGFDADIAIKAVMQSALVSHTESDAMARSPDCKRT